MSKYAVLIVAILVVSASAAAFAGPAGAASSPTRRLGFWLQDGDVLKYPAQTFFNSMFLTPPYPSSLEVMIFAIQQDELNNFGCSANTPYVSGAIKYWGQVAQLADSYPNIKLIFEVQYNPASGGTGTYGLQCYNTIVKALGQYPSVYGIGVEGEYTTTSMGMTQAQMQTAMNDVTATGKLFISYYINSPLSVPSGGYDIYHTNFPAQGDQVGTLTTTTSQGVGLSSGYYDDFAFPSTISCPVGANAIASGSLTKEPQGWDQCVVSTELSTAVSVSASQRQFLEFAVGFSSSGYFTGVSGQSTNQLWDNPTLRNWIWTDPNYQSNFILSTGSSGSSSSVVTTSQTTTSTSHTTTSTSTSSSHTVTTSTTTSITTSSADPPAQDPAYSLTMGISCPAGVQYCGKVSPVGTWSYSTVTLTGTAYGGYAFSYWSVCTTTCQVYGGNPLTLTLSAVTKATAVFIVDRSN